jgi:sugar lactone lactonase YvrE
MLSLCFEGSRPGSAHKWFQRSRAVCGVFIAASLGVVACSKDDDGGGDVALADSGSVAELATQIGIPTTVAVADGVAWVVESQFDRYAPLSGPNVGEPAPFRLVGVKLDNTSRDYQEIELPDQFFPEGITATKGGRLYVGSVATGAIYTVAAGETTAELFSDALAPSTVGMTVSTDGNTLWVCNSNLTTGAAAVAGIDIATQAFLVSHTIPPFGANAGAFCNDMVMSPDGSLWVTESFGGQIFKIPAENLLTKDSAEVWLQAGKLTPPDASSFGVNGITLLDGTMYLVNTDRPALLRIDPSLEVPTANDLETVDLFDDNNDSVTLVRPDGITAIPGSNTDILIVENGLAVDGGKNVLRARLDRL